MYIRVKVVCTIEATASWS